MHVADERLAYPLTFCGSLMCLLACLLSVRSCKWPTTVVKPLSAAAAALADEEKKAAALAASGMFCPGYTKLLLPMHVLPRHALKARSNVML